MYASTKPIHGRTTSTTDPRASSPIPWLKDTCTPSKHTTTCFRRVADIALSIEGKPRQQGVHAAGVIIASDEIQKFCPLHHDPETNVTCTGLDMEASESWASQVRDFLDQNA